LEGYIKYLVQAQCQPSPVGHEEAIVQSLSRNFNVKQCSCDSTGVTLELEYNHPLADGAFKDLADLLIDVLAEQKLRLRSGVINRVEAGSLSTIVGAFIGSFNRGLSGDRGLSGRWLETSDLVFNFLTSGSFRRIAGGGFGETRLVPVMYFYREVILDLMLAGKARRLSMNPVTGSN